VKKLIVLLLFLSSSLFADSNSGCQAIVKIELINGKSFEAILPIATTKNLGGGYFYQNGFMIVSQGNARYGFLFGADFNKISFIADTDLPQSSSASTRIIRRKNNSVFFLRGTSSQGMENKKVSIDSEIDSKSGKETYRRTFHIIQEYILEDSIEVYRYLPVEYVLTLGKTSHKAQKVSVNDLSSIELIRVPSQKWLDSIKMAQEEWWKQYKDAPCPPSGPLWYHIFFDNDGKLMSTQIELLKRFEEY